MTDQAVADRRLHPGTVLLKFLKHLPQTVAGIPVLVAIASRAGWGYFTVALLAFAIVYTLAHWLSWRRFSYGLDADEMVIESGVFDHSRRTIPFDRILDVDVEQQLLHRLFGLAKVRIETGGPSKDEGTLDSVSVAEAERLRAAIRERRGRSVREEQEAADEAPLFAMSARRVIASGPFNFSVFWIAATYPALQAVDRVVSFDLDDVGRWIGIVEAHTAEWPIVETVALVAALAILLGYLTGLIRVLLRDFGFKLNDEGRGLRRERGLLTRSAVVITKKRVQLALIESGPVQRALGWYGLRLQTLGASETQNQGGLQHAAPFARIEEIERVMAAAGGFRLPDPETLQRVSHRHIWKAVMMAVALPIVPVIVATVFMPVLVLTALAIPVFVAMALVERRFHRYALDGDLLFIQSGWWQRRIWVLPVRNIQTMTVERGWVQRLLGLSTLALDTAGAAYYPFPVIRDLRADLAEALAERIDEARGR